MSDDRQAPRRRRRPTVAPAPQEPMRIIVGNEEDTPDWMVSDTSGAASRRTGQKKPEPETPRTRRPRRSGNPDDFADEAAAQRPKRGARRAHGVGSKEDRRAESRTKNRCVRAESARPKEKKRAPDEQKGKRAPRASNPPNDHRRALRRDRRRAGGHRHSRGQSFGGHQADARPRRRRVLSKHLRQQYPASGQNAR